MLAIAFALPWVNEPTLSLNPVREFLVFVTVLIALAVSVTCVWNVGAWPSLFCATAGYTMQNLASSLATLVHQIAGTDGRPPAFVNLLTVVITYAACYVLLTRKISAHSLQTTSNRFMLAMFAIVSFVVIGFDVILKYVEALNIRLHDLRHLIRDCGGRAASVEPGALEEIEREVSAYDTAVKTGNAALDTVLTEKVAFGRRRGVQLLCTADGAAIGFMRPSDLYALFGNALDNAIEAAAAESDPERRVITLSVRSLTGMAAVNVENYCSTELDFRDGLPLTTKDDKNRHGFGMKSMRLIAERYGGSLEASQHGDVFSLNILLSPAGTTSATS